MASATGPPRFRYEAYDVDPASGLLTCRYSVGDYSFEERITFAATGRWDDPKIAEAARLVFLLGGVSYYKVMAPPVIDLGETAVTDVERDFLRSFFQNGLGEYAYRNGLDLSAIRIEGPTRKDLDTGQAALDRPAAMPARPLVPFGGGIDSIVTAELVRSRADPALFIVSGSGGRFQAIERSAAVTGLPIVRAERQIDAQLLTDARRPVPRFLNGHVPVTGILSAVAVMAALLEGRDSVVMSNEWSASIATLEIGDSSINHQYSKSAAFEAGFRMVLTGVLGDRMTYFSALRPFTELWVARRFARLTAYHDTFHSCNRAFYIDPAQRLDRWCGTCDKCCFIDLILAPFLPAVDLDRIFGGREPLNHPDSSTSLTGRFRALLGLSPDSKPFECVGEVGECRAAVLLAAGRPDRAASMAVQKLARELRDLPEGMSTADLLRPIGEHFIPDAYATDDLLV